jgi:hypothetical protein
MDKICNKPDCNNPVPQVHPYKLFGSEVLYCSRGCVEWAFNEKTKRHKIPVKVLTDDEVYAILHPPPEEPAVDQIAKEFGDAGVVRKLCDNPACRRVVTLAWKGRHGEYCSNDCLKREKLGDNMTVATEVDVNDATTATATAPITGGSKKVVSKKAAPKAAVKKVAAPVKAAPSKVASKKVAAPAKKAGKKAAAPETNGSGRATTFDRTHVIRRTDTWKECKSLKGSGTSSERVKAIKDGMTVGDYLEALRKAGLPAGLGNLQACEKGGFVTVADEG